MTTYQMEIFGAAVGLVRTMDKVGADAQSDELLLAALSALDDSPQADWVEKLHEQKNILSPDCAVCPTPCGHNDDFDLSTMNLLPDEIREKKNAVINAVLRLAKSDSPDLDLLHRGVFIIGEYVDAAMLDGLLQKFC